MFRTDKEVERVAPSFTRGTLSQERWNEYRRLFRILNLESGIEGYGEKDFIWFHASSSGLATSGSSKGFIYTLTPIEALVDDLDITANEVSYEGRIYRHLEGSWYLYYEGN
jgi:hypothetical protein